MSATGTTTLRALPDRRSAAGPLREDRLRGRADDGDGAAGAAARNGTTAAAPHCRAGIMLATAKFAIGQIVRHRIYPFRGVIFDVDPQFANTEEWWQSIPEEVRPRKDQPFYHLLAENAETTYRAYVSEQNLLPDDSGKPVGHPGVKSMFGDFGGDRYEFRRNAAH